MEMAKDAEKNEGKKNEKYINIFQGGALIKCMYCSKLLDLGPDHVTKVNWKNIQKIFYNFT